MNSHTSNYNYNNFKKDNWWFLGELPPKNGRYIVLDTETTGFSALSNNVIEVAAIEISKGKLTGLQYHCFIKPRNPVDPRAEEKHKLGNNFYEEFFNDVYHSDRLNMENFIKFVGNSVIFAHNASFDYHFINNELKFWKLPVIPKGRFRCTMRIFKTIFSQVDANFKKYCSLEKCCEYFRLKSSKYSFHTAIFDSFMTARLLCKMYEYVEYQRNYPEREKESIRVNGVNGNNINYNNKILRTNFNNISPNSDLNINTTQVSLVEERERMNIDINADPNNKENVLIRQVYSQNVYSENSQVEMNKHSCLNNGYNMLKENENEEMNYENENDDPNIVDKDMDFLQEYEGFIKSYMEDDKAKINENEGGIETVQHINHINDLKIDDFNNFNNYEINNNYSIHQSHFGNVTEIQNDATPSESGSKHSKYKELMRQYLNTCDLSNQNSNLNENKNPNLPKNEIEDEDDLVMLEDADLEEIIRDNI